MIILGIETSCDETALALIETRSDQKTGGGNTRAFECRVIQSLVHSQAELHSAYGGVFPTLAKREHGKNIVPLLHKLMIEAGDVFKSDAERREHSHSGQFPLSNSPGIQSVGSVPHGNVLHAPLADSQFKAVLESFRADVERQNPELFESFAGADFLKSIPPIDRIAVTEGPGLEPTLWVGINFARMLAALWDVPIIPIDHMEGHILGSLLPSDATNGAWQNLYDALMPAIALLISGGHTELVKVSRLGDYEILGRTRDDAVGEAFDKAARLLGLPYPGGPHLAELSHKAWEEKTPSPVKLPRPMLKSGDLDFSFAGLKTAVLYAVRDAAIQETPTGSRTIPIETALDKKDSVAAQDVTIDESVAQKKAADKNVSIGTTDNGTHPNKAAIKPPSTTDRFELSDDFKKGLAREFEQAVADTLDGKLRTAIERIGARSIIVGGGVSANHFLRQGFGKTAAEYGIPIFLPSRHISGDNALMIAVAGALHQADAKTPGLIRAHGTKHLGV
jgi:glycoprotease/Kae1 family metallohydrolase